MSNTPAVTPDNALDLVLERQIDAPKSLVWRALTEADLVRQWFCPKPWQVADCRIDLRAGGEFYTVMQSPEGQNFPSTGCFLEIIPEKKLVWTSALQTGFRPVAPVSATDKDCASILMTCIITLEATSGSTRYKAHVLHGSAEQKQRHEAMGFHDGWGVCLTQLAELVKAL